MGRLVKKTTQSKSKDKAAQKKTHSLDAKIKNVVTSSWFFFHTNSIPGFDHIHETF